MSWFKKRREPEKLAEQCGIVRVASNSCSDLIDGYQFFATLSFRTPLNILNMHGMIVKTEHDCIDYRSNKAEDPYGMHGIWIYKLKPWEELGSSQFQEGESSHASVFGSVFPSAILPLLKAYREIIESSEDPAIKYQLLKELYLQRDDWKKFINYAVKERFGDLADYWAITNLTNIKSIGRIKARKLVSQGVYTEEEYWEKYSKKKT